MTASGPSRIALEAAIVLSMVGSDADREVLRAALEAPDFDLEADPERPNASEGGLDNPSSRASAADALRRLDEAKGSAAASQGGRPAPAENTPAPSPSPTSTPPSAEALAAARATKIVEAFNGTDAERRERAVMAAGAYRVDALYPQVLTLALSGSSETRTIALRALLFYRRPVAPDVLNRLLENPDLEQRLIALDLATCHEESTYAPQALALARALAARPLSDFDKEMDQHGEMPPLDQQFVVLLPRLLQGGVTPPWRAGLDDPNPRVRRV